MTLDPRTGKPTGLARHFHQSFASRDACESCMAEIARLRAIPQSAPTIDVELLKQALDNEWTDRLASGDWYDDDAADPFVLRAPRIAAEYERLARLAAETPE